MKAKAIDSPKVFDPVTIELTIESEEELLDLWHRLNLNDSKINNLIEIKSRHFYKHRITGNKTHILWGILDDIIHIRKIEK